MFYSINFNLQPKILIPTHIHLRRLTITNQSTTNFLLIFAILYNSYYNNYCELTGSHRQNMAALFFLLYFNILYW